jgi:MFS family permease
LQGHGVSKFGTALFDIVLVLWLKDRWGSAGLIGMILMLSNLPEILLSPLGGVLADIRSRKKIMILSDGVCGLALLAAWAGVLLLPYRSILSAAIVAAASVVVGISASFFNPAVSALIPVLAGGKSLEKTNSAYQFVTSLAGFAGQVSGGLLFRLFGAPLLILANGLSFLFSAVTELFIKVPERERTPASNARPFTTFFDSLKGGFRVIAGNRGLSAFLAVLPFLVTDTLNLSPVWYGYAMAGFGIGILTGFALAGIIRFGGQSRSRWLFLLFFLFALSFALLGLNRLALLLPVITGAMGFFVASIVVNLNLVIQLSIPNEFHGRVFGLYHTLTTAAMPLGMGLSGLVLELIQRRLPERTDGPALIFLACGTALLLVAFPIPALRLFRDFLAVEAATGQTTGSDP